MASVEEKAQRRRPPLFVKYFGKKGVTVEDYSIEELREFQDEALRQLVARAYSRNPFYRKKMQDAGIKPQDIQGADQLYRMPTTTKDELREDPWILLACDRQEVSLIHVSTGTTGGKEIYLPWTWHDYYRNELTPAMSKLVDEGPGDIVLNALPYEMSSAGLAFHKVFIDGCGAAVIPAGKGGAYSSPEKTVRLMQDIPPTVVITTPSYAMTLAETAERLGFDLTTLSLRKMWLTGEGCSYAFRSRVEALWGTKANFYYGSLECGALGIECDSHAGYHIPMAHCYVEIVDPKTGQVLEPGEIGEIVVTNLLRRDTPLIRYRTQDLGYIETDPCRCGVRLPRLFLRGRMVDQIEIGGVSFSPFYIEEFLMRMPEVGHWYHFVVPRDGKELLVRTELAPGYEPSAELADRLASQLEYHVGVPCRFEFVDQIPRPSGKTVRVIYEQESEAE